MHLGLARALFAWTVLATSTPIYIWSATYYEPSRALCGPTSRPRTMRILAFLSMAPAPVAGATLRGEALQGRRRHNGQFPLSRLATPPKTLTPRRRRQSAQGNTAHSGTMRPLPRGRCLPGRTRFRRRARRLTVSRIHCSGMRLSPKELRHGREPPRSPRALGAKCQSPRPRVCLMIQGVYRDHA